MRRRWVVPAVGIGGAAALGVATVLALPGYVARRCVQAAAKTGVTLTVGRARVALDGVALEDVVAVSPEVPGVRVAVPRVTFSPLAWRPTHASLEQVEVTVDGSVDGVLRAVGAFEAKHELPPDAASIGRVEIASAHVVWAHPVAWVDRVEAAGSGSWTRDDGTVTASGATLRAWTGGGDAWGPWTADASLGGPSSQATVWLDAARSAKVTLEASASSAQLGIDVPRTLVAKLGVPSSALGRWATGATSVEASIDLAGPPLGPLRGHASVAGYEVRVPMLAAPTGVRVRGEVTASLPGTFTIDHGELGVPPLLGSLNGKGSIERDGALHASAVVDGALSCADAAQLAAQSVLGAAVPPAVARAVAGDVAVHTTIRYDPGARPALSVVAQPTPHCTAMPSRLFDAAVATVQRHLEHDWLGMP